MLFDDTRSDWGARKPTSVKAVGITARTEFFTHWAGLPAGLFGRPHAACLAQVKAWQNQHMDQQGWSDIGYNGLICVHARSIEGRGRDYAGAHCSNHNTSGIGWQFMVGEGEVITDAMLARMRRVYDDCSTASGKNLAKRTHSDGFSTECGGDQCRAWTHAGMPVNAKEDGLAAADVKEIKDYLYALLIGGYDTAGVRHPGGLKVVEDVQSKVAALTPAAVTAAVKAALPADLGVDVDALARKIVVELGRS